MNAGIAAAALMIVRVPARSHLTGRYSSEGTGRTRPPEKFIKSRRLEKNKGLIERLLLPDHCLTVGLRPLFLMGFTGDEGGSFRPICWSWKS
jgi:hypothetical protein